MGVLTRCQSTARVMPGTGDKKGISAMMDPGTSELLSSSCFSSARDGPVEQARSIITCRSCRSLLATLTALVLAVVLLPDPELGLRELDLSSLFIPEVDANSVAAEVGLTHGDVFLYLEECA